VVELSGSTDPLYTSVAEYCESGTNTFAALDGCHVESFNEQDEEWIRAVECVTRLTSRYCNLV